MTERPNSFSTADIVRPFPGNRRILFGHQSIGSNILDGVRLLSSASSIVEIAGDAPMPDRNGIFHFRIGENQRPYSKIDDFARLVTANDTLCDLAMMKLCYVDIGKNTDIYDLFRYYRSMVEKLVRSAPDVRLLHITVPLRSIRLGLRSRIKLLAGQDLKPVEENIRREAYNSLMRKEYQGESSLFDLAMLESTRPDGSTSSVSVGGREIKTLYTGYSDDGGHLNTDGKQLVAQQLIDFINELLVGP